jgi:hypothetical protein
MAWAPSAGGAPAAAGGFTVRAGELARGSSQVTAQAQQCLQAATAAVEAIAQMAGAAGDPGLADALVAASDVGTQTFLVTNAVYAYVAGSLRQSAAGYSEADQACIRQLGGLW